MEAGGVVTTARRCGGEAGRGEWLGPNRWGRRGSWGSAGRGWGTEGGGGRGGAGGACGVAGRGERRRIGGVVVRGEVVRRVRWRAGRERGYGSGWRGGLPTPVRGAGVPWIRGRWSGRTVRCAEAELTVGGATPTSGRGTPGEGFRVRGRGGEGRGARGVCGRAGPGCGRGASGGREAGGASGLSRARGCGGDGERVAGPGRGVVAGVWRSPGRRTEAQARLGRSVEGDAGTVPGAGVDDSRCVGVVGPTSTRAGRRRVRGGGLSLPASPGPPGCRGRASGCRQGPRLPDRPGELPPGRRSGRRRTGAWVRTGGAVAAGS